MKLGTWVNATMGKTIKSSLLHLPPPLLPSYSPSMEGAEDLATEVEEDDDFDTVLLTIDNRDTLTEFIDSCIL